MWLPENFSHFIKQHFNRSYLKNLTGMHSKMMLYTCSDKSNIKSPTFHMLVCLPATRLSWARCRALELFHTIKATVVDLLKFSSEDNIPAVLWQLCLHKNMACPWYNL